MVMIKVAVRGNVGLGLGVKAGNLWLSRAEDLRGGLGDDQTSEDPLKVGQKAGQADGPSLEGSNEGGTPLVAGGESETLQEASSEGITFHETSNKGGTLQEAGGEDRTLQEAISEGDTGVRGCCSSGIGGR